MGKLYEARLKLEQVIKERNLDIYKTKGAIGLKSGLMIDLLKPETPDDPTKVEKLKLAVKEVLSISI